MTLASCELINNGITEGFAELKPLLHSILQNIMKNCDLVLPLNRQSMLSINFNILCIDLAAQHIMKDTPITTIAISGTAYCFCWIVACGLSVSASRAAARVTPARRK